MGTDKHGLFDSDLTEKVIGAFYSVYNELGHGFVESVYRNAFAYELGTQGLRVEKEFPLTVRFRDIVVGQFRADLVVEGRLLVELKSTTQLLSAHEIQLINYLKATRLRLGLLLNFGPRAEIKRRIFDCNKSVKIGFHP